MTHLNRHDLQYDIAWGPKSCSTGRCSTRHSVMLMFLAVWTLIGPTSKADSQPSTIQPRDDASDILLPLNDPNAI